MGFSLHPGLRVGIGLFCNYPKKEKIVIKELGFIII